MQGPVSEDKAELANFWDVVDSIVNGSVANAVEAARQCQHPDAKWLAALFPSPASVSQDEWTAVMQVQGDNPVALFLGAVVGGNEALARRAAAMGYAPAQAWLGSLATLEVEERIEFARQAVAQGNRAGLFALASLLAKRDDEAAAVPLYEQAAALGHAEAQLALGLRCLQGWGQEAQEAAQRWFALAAARGCAEAQYELALCYAYAEEHQLAREWLEKAAKTDARACFCLGMIYRDGRGVEQDEATALALFTRAGGLGHTGAQLNAGLIAGQRGDHDAAFEEVSRAAHGNNAMGMCYLADIFEDSARKQHSVELAADWYKKSAELGYFFAQFKLGLCYRDGQGVEQSDVAAVEWLQRSACQGCAPAQFNLGCHFDLGHGVEKVCFLFSASYFSSFLLPERTLQQPCTGSNEQRGEVMFRQCSTPRGCWRMAKGAKRTTLVRSSGWSALQNAATRQLRQISRHVTFMATVFPRASAGHLHCTLGQQSKSTWEGCTIWASCIETEKAVKRIPKLRLVSLSAQCALGIGWQRSVWQSCWQMETA